MSKYVQSVYMKQNLGDGHRKQDQSCTMSKRSHMCLQA